MDPATFDAQKMRNLHAIGINRVSLGLQSFNDTTLGLLGRAHKVDDIYRAIESVVDGGIEVSKERRHGLRPWSILFLNHFIHRTSAWI